MWGLLQEFHTYVLKPMMEGELCHDRIRNVLSQRLYI